MNKVTFVDLETSGLCPERCQILEVGLVTVRDGEIVAHTHFYIDHPLITFEHGALVKFGDRHHDRVSGVEVATPFHAGYLIPDHLNVNWSGKALLGGKNVAGFDRLFLDRLILGLPAGHRTVDIGNIYCRHDDPTIPDLAQCVKRGKLMGIEVTKEVTHTALDDAWVCAELYAGWWKRQRDQTNLVTNWCKNG
jgi:DNA polymerase III epsilon subunit-like protein